MALCYLRGLVKRKESINGNDKWLSSKVHLTVDVHSEAEHVGVWLGRSAPPSNIALNVRQTLGEDTNLLDIYVDGQLMDATRVHADSRLGTQSGFT
jgi:hypothetical protein